MNRLQNFLAIVTVSMLGISVASFIFSAISAVISAEAVVGLFGYIGVYFGLTMLATGSVLSIISVFNTAQEYLHHHSMETWI